MQTTNWWHKDKITGKKLHVQEEFWNQINNPTKTNPKKYWDREIYPPKVKKSITSHRNFVRNKEKVNGMLFNTSRSICQWEINIFRTDEET